MARSRPEPDDPDEREHRLRDLRPELVLAHKARHRRPGDDDDLAATLPLLEPSARTWLRAYLAASEPRGLARTRRARRRTI